MTIARVWGTSLGFPNPGLQPSRAEWTEQRLIARQAVDAFEKAGFDQLRRGARHPPRAQADVGEARKATWTRS